MTLAFFCVKNINENYNQCQKHFIHSNILPNWLWIHTYWTFYLEFTKKLYDLHNFKKQLIYRHGKIFNNFNKIKQKRSNTKKNLERTSAVILGICQSYPPNGPNKSNPIKCISSFEIIGLSKIQCIITRANKWKTWTQTFMNICKPKNFVIHWLGRSLNPGKSYCSLVNFLYFSFYWSTLGFAFSWLYDIL